MGLFVDYFYSQPGLPVFYKLQGFNFGNYGIARHLVRRVSVRAFFGLLGLGVPRGVLSGHHQHYLDLYCNVFLHCNRQIIVIFEAQGAAMSEAPFPPDLGAPDLLVYKKFQEVLSCKYLFTLGNQLMGAHNFKIYKIQIQK